MREPTEENVGATQELQVSTHEKKMVLKRLGLMQEKIQPCIERHRNVIKFADN